MATTNLCEYWSVMAAGKWSLAISYAPTFLAMADISLLGLPLLWTLARVDNSSAGQGDVDSGAGADGASVPDS
jgi:hypothetical protein